MTSDRVERLREWLDALSGPDPWPEHLDAPEEEAWMDRVGADSGLAGLLTSAVHGQRYSRRELAEYRAASERFGSCLDPAVVAEAYDLLAQP